MLIQQIYLVALAVAIICVTGSDGPTGATGAIIQAAAIGGRW